MDDHQTILPDLHAIASLFHYDIVRTSGDKIVMAFRSLMDAAHFVSTYEIQAHATIDNLGTIALSQFPFNQPTVVILSEGWKDLFTIGDERNQVT